MKPHPIDRRQHRCLLLTAVALLAAACSHLPGSAPAPTQPPGEHWLRNLPAQRSQPVGPGESLLLYYDYLRALSATELARENEHLKQATATDKTDFTRLRHALLLAMPAFAARDHARAQQLLEPLRDAKSTDPVLRAFAALLVADLAERRRLEDSLQSATQRQRDEQARAADLQQKLDALKAIEKSIAERKPAPAGSPANKPAAPRK